MKFAIVENAAVVNLAEFEKIDDAVSMGLTVAECDELPVYIGDEYRNGHFYRDGERIKSPEDLLADALQALAIIYGEAK